MLYASVVSLLDSLISKDPSDYHKAKLVSDFRAGKGNESEDPCFFNISKPIAHADLIWLNNAFINPKKSNLSTKKVDRDELYDFQSGFLTLFCKGNRSTKEVIDSQIRKYSSIVGNLTISIKNNIFIGLFREKRNWPLFQFPNAALVVRYEFANPYWVILDIVDLYLSFQQSGK